MRKRLAIGILLGLLIFGLATMLSQALRAQTVGPSNTIFCNKTATLSTIAATTVSLIAGISGQTIFICGWHFTSNQSGSSTFQFIQGTQGASINACSSSSNLTPPFNVTSSAPSGDHIDFAQISASQSNQVCVITSGATIGQAGLVYFAQF